MEDIIKKARLLAESAHEGQFRNDGKTPYIKHPERVANALMGLPEEVVAAGWLHDVVEDTPVDLDELVEMGFPDEVVRLVNALTHRKQEESYYQYINRVIEAGFYATKIKKADILHNLQSAKKGSLRDKYELAVAYIRAVEKEKYGVR